MSLCLNGIYFLRRLNGQNFITTLTKGSTLRKYYVDCYNEADILLWCTCII